jgi:hypothetical protein
MYNLLPLLMKDQLSKDQRALVVWRSTSPPAHRVASCCTLFRASRTMSAPFNVNERVLCFHGPLIYEAKVLQAVHHDDPAPLTGKVGWHYFVHYKGWKQK